MWDPSDIVKIAPYAEAAFSRYEVHRPSLTLPSQVAKICHAGMRVISRRALREFVDRHPDAGPSLDLWYRVAKRASWANLSEVRQAFRSADAVRDLTVFNISGNKYRLITRINYERQIVYVRAVLTHNEYDQGKWKSDN